MLMQKKFLHKTLNRKHKKILINQSNQLLKKISNKLNKIKMLNLK